MKITGNQFYLCRNEDERKVNSTECSKFQIQLFFIRKRSTEKDFQGMHLNLQTLFQSNLGSGLAGKNCSMVVALVMRLRSFRTVNITSLEEWELLFKICQWKVGWRLRGQFLTIMQNLNLEPLKYDITCTNFENVSAVDPWPLNLYKMPG